MLDAQRVKCQIKCTESLSHDQTLVVVTSSGPHEGRDAGDADSSYSVVDLLIFTHGVSFVILSGFITKRQANPSTDHQQHPQDFHD